MKTAYIGLILILLVIAGIVYFVYTPKVQAQSTLVIAVKDAPKKSEFGNITSLILTFSEVSVHKASNVEQINTSIGEMNTTESNETQEADWIVVVNEVQTVDLLQFTDVSKILGQETLDAGRYTQIRLKIDSGTVTIDGVTYNLTIPSAVLKLNRGFVLEQNTTLKLTLDFNVEKSLARTGNGKFILKPVIAVISEVNSTSETEQSCINSGGTVGTSLCCKSAGDFPDTCLVGACGCSPENSHSVKICECPEVKCFDGNECVSTTCPKAPPCPVPLVYGDPSPDDPNQCPRYYCPA